MRKKVYPLGVVIFWGLIGGCCCKYISGVSSLIEEDIYININNNDKIIQFNTLHTEATHNPWPNNNVFFVVDDSIRTDLATYANVKTALITVEDKTSSCIRFVPKTSSTPDYINITREGNGCYSSVGRIGGEQTVNIGPGCESVGVIMHELLHALGFWHEQSRSDRDSYVVINYQNIMFGRDVEFSKRTGLEELEKVIPYDFRSILHYKYNAFAKLKTLDTIVPNQKYSNVDKTVLGQRQELSDEDVNKILWLYKCGKFAVSQCQARTDENLVSNPSQTIYAPDVAVQYSCAYGKLIGPNFSTCQSDGTWSGGVPYCTKVSPYYYQFCDMESGCFQGWNVLSSKPDQWARKQGATTTAGTGPSADHTYGTPTGSYLLFNASGLASGDFALVLSPRVHVRYGVNTCILFYYHMYGTDMGSLTVYANWAPVFRKAESGENKWTRVLVTNISTWYSYIIVMFHATRGAGDASDIAIDDVFIGPCSDVTQYENVIKST